MASPRMVSRQPQQFDAQNAVHGEHPVIVEGNGRCVAPVVPLTRFHNHIRRLGVGERKHQSVNQTVNVACRFARQPSKSLRH